MVATAQRLPVRQLNWCEPAGIDQRLPRSASNYSGNTYR
jgi:hypothetical protein